jgi:TPR repeat protein
MMEELSNEGHPPAQTFQADYLIARHPSEENIIKAQHLYEQALSQGYKPAEEKLASLKQLP